MQADYRFVFEYYCVGSRNKFTDLHSRRPMWACVNYGRENQTKNTARTRDSISL